jgi:hypothetical protein
MTAAIIAGAIVYLIVGFFIALGCMLPDGNPTAKWGLVIWIGWPVYLVGVMFGWWK